VTHSELNPRCSTAAASGPAPMPSSVMNVEMPNFTLMAPLPRGRSFSLLLSRFRH
jgi:hypothetical protein